MQDEHNDSPSPPSRRPITQQEQSQRDYARQNVPQLPQQQLSSQIWTPSQSFSSQSSQEHDPHFHVPLQDPRLPSLQASFQHERPPPPSLQPPTRYPATTTSDYFQYASEDAGILTQTGYSERTDTQYSHPYLQHSLPQGAESQGPPLPYPYPGSSGYQEPPPPPPQREQHSYLELPTRGGSHSPHTARHGRPRRTPPSDPPYPTRRPSQDFRQPLQSFESSLSQPFQPSSRPPSRPPSRGPSRPTQLYRSPSSGSHYRSQAGPPLQSYLPERGQAGRTAIPVMAPQQFTHPLPHAPTQSPFSQTPIPQTQTMSMPVQLQSGRDSPFSHQTMSMPAQLRSGRESPFSHQTMSMPVQLRSGRESPLSQAPTPTYHRLTGGGPSRPLPNVGELTPTGLYPPAQPAGPLPTPRRTHRAHPYQPPPTSPIHHTRTARRRSQPDTPTTPPKRRRPPEPYSSYANMLADIISHHPRRKLTLQELYILLKSQYGDHFPDDGIDDSKPGANGGGWRNTVRHALSVNKWFRKQYRTNADARLDEEDPDRYEPPPIDEDSDSDGKAVTVAPPTRRAQEGEIPGGTRPLKGGYWFIRDKYRNEVAEAVARDKERTEQSQREREEDERLRQISRMHSRHVSPAIPQIPLSHRGQRVDLLSQGYIYNVDRPRGSGSYERSTGAHHHNTGYPPPRP